MNELDHPESSAQWVDVGDIADVIKRRKFVIGEEPNEIVVVCHDGGVYALQNVCIHKGRELGKGVVLRDRLVCPGHQWSFDLQTGWESVKERCQPTYEVRITDAGRVEVDVASRRIAVAEPSATETSS